MESIDLMTLWVGMLEELKKTVPPRIYTAFFEGEIIPYSYENNVLTLDTTQEFICKYVGNKYTPLLETVAKNVTGMTTTIKLITSSVGVSIPPEPTETISVEDIKQVQRQPKPQPVQPVNTTFTAPEEMKWEQPVLPSMDSYPPESPENMDIRTAADIQEPAPLERTETNLIHNYTFETFVVANSNRIAHATALAIAEGKKINPFYIFGGSGLGKTHLMHAIGHRILQNFPDTRLRCITSEDFVNEFIQSIQDKSTESFRQRYRNIDVLLVDDIQFLGRGDKDSSKEEFFHTFNKLYQEQKQMVFTSDRPPQDIKRLEDRLRSRFQSGMIASIDPPDLETRTAILRNWAEKEHVDIEPDAINYIAANVNENIRDLNGAFISVQGLSSQLKSKITLTLTQQALKYLTDAKDEKKYITIDEITKSVCEYYRIPYKELMGKKKTKDITMPRQIAMYLCRELTDNTYPHIGTAFNGRDHSTVMHACSKVAKTMEKDSHFREKIEELKIKITGVDN
ncbi:MAG: chromosomal replication initiator protein DnaA [Megasphaera sp.]|jgi:chromosomal replication initiator protein|nr:chromosomal replication initiator protein DnaA [Megasphaera sp.]MCH4187528.1 chromosomal replication initiator protein DnaA [Megasphaera sp.]MCH4217748.1 chromosomal replication initiator protein DnaA [Megasphaera sp.]